VGEGERGGLQKVLLPTEEGFRVRGEMENSKMNSNEENYTNKLTIVGGQASEKSNSLSFSTNIEKILIKAASDETFRKVLMEDRKSVLEKEQLNPTDKMLLGTIPLKQLNNMIDKFSGYRSSRREFLKGAAASALFLTGFVPAMAIAQDAYDELFTYGIDHHMPEPHVLEITKTVTSDGAVINYNYTGLRLVIPPDALDKPVNINIEAINPPDKEPEKSFFKGHIYKFSPENLEFLKEITIYFPAFGMIVNIVPYRWEVSEWKDISSELLTLPDEPGIFPVKTRKFGFYALGVKV